jgi:hypothetical protein
MAKGQRQWRPAAVETASTVIITVAAAVEKMMIGSSFFVQKHYWNLEQEVVFEN